MAIDKWPMAHDRSLILYISEFESKFETVLAHKSVDPVGTFDEITIDKKISRYGPLRKKQK